jgi:6-pyruvoyltetrahydropterin/6-carboxytetrahydropterin synthase
LEVTVCGNVNPDTGYLMDLTKLKKIVKELVIDIVDHKNINTDVPFMKDIIPTTENIAIMIWDVLKEHLEINNKGVWLYSIKIFETENNIVEFKG